MPIRADQMRDLMALGISAETMLDIVTIFERDASRDGRDGKALAAERARKYRARKQEKSGMARHVARETQQPASRDASRLECDGAHILSSSLLPLKGTPEEEVREKKERKTRAPKKIPLPLADDWQPNEAHAAKAAEFGLSREIMNGKAEDMRIWAQSNDVRKADWNATFHGFLRRTASDKRVSNGYRGPQPLQDDSKSISAAAGRLAEAAERGEYTFGPRPSLLPDPNEAPVFLLSKG